MRMWRRNSTKMEIHQRILGFPRRLHDGYIERYTISHIADNEMKRPSPMLGMRGHFLGFAVRFPYDYSLAQLSNKLLQATTPAEKELAVCRFERALYKTQMKALKREKY